MAYSAQATLASSTSFRDRVRVAVAKAALDVMGEAQGQMSDAEFGKRQALADEVIAAAFGGTVLDRFVWAVVQNEAVTDASADSDIQFTVNSVWPDLAGVRETD